MKFIFVDNGLLMLTNFRLDVAKYYRQAGHEVILCYPKCTETEDLLKRIPNDIKIAPVNCNPSKISPLEDIRYFLELRKLYKKEQPNIVFHYTIKPNIYGAMAAKSLGIKCVDMLAGLGYIFSENGLKNIIGQKMYKFSLLSADRVITLNRPNYEFILSNGYAKKEKLILFEGGEGVNLEKFPYAKNQFDETRFLMVARVLYDKGYQEYVDAAEIVKAKYPNTKIELLGPLDEISPMGVPREVVENDTKSGKISYLGSTNDVPSYLRQNGVVVVVVSSYNEGLNRSLMEACAMARPIITTNIPGCQETVDDGISGYLVPVKDSKSLAETMIKFIELSREQKEQMAEASYAKALKNFDLESVLKKYDNIIDEIINS